MLSPQINIGPFTFHIYGLVIAIAVIIGWSIARSKAWKSHIPEDLFEDKILLVPLILSITFARIYHVVDYWGYYSQNLITILQIQNGGLGIWGAVFGFFLGLYIISKLKKVKFFTLADVCAPSFLLAQAIGRVGNFINQEGFGPPTSLPWKVYINPENRPPKYISSNYFHPTFFYEAIMDLIFFVVLIKYAKQKRKTGKIFALYIVLYSVGRLIAEYFRVDTWQIMGIKTAYLLCLAGIIIGIWLLQTSKNHRVDTT